MLLDDTTEAARAHVGSVEEAHRLEGVICPGPGPGPRLILFFASNTDSSSTWRVTFIQRMERDLDFQATQSLRQRGRLCSSQHSQALRILYGVVPDQVHMFAISASI